MKIWLPAMTLSVALITGVSMIPSGAQAMGIAGGAAAGAAARAGGRFGGRGFGFHHGFGFRRPFPFPRRPFHSPLNFGAGFASHQSNVVAGGIGDASDDYGDDIESLHFRVQEPFGPWDIGRPRPEEDAPYISDRMEPPPPGYAPDW